MQTLVSAFSKNIINFGPRKINFALQEKTSKINFALQEKTSKINFVLQEKTSKINWVEKLGLRKITGRKTLIRLIRKSVVL